MGQFFFGLAAGIIVGLVMEWVIDWAGLLPARSVKRQAQVVTRTEGNAGSKPIDSGSAPVPIAEKIPHENNDLGRE